MSILFKNLSCKLGGREILKNISGNFESGKVTAILGSNGCGKSTWVRALLGLVKCQLGEIHGHFEVKGYLPQKKEIYWPLTCEAIVGLGVASYELRVAKSVDSILDRLNIGHLRSKRIDEISGGERTLVLLARVLRDKPDLVIADEPTAELDPKHQLRVMQILKEEAARGAIVIVTMHDIQLTAQFADFVFLMRDGSLVFQGAPETALNPIHLEEIFGVAFTEGKGLYAK